MLHGDALMTLADTCGGVGAFLNLPGPAYATTTTSSTTQLVRAVRGGVVTATARPLHVGRRSIVVETRLVDDEGRRLVATTTQAQAVLDPR